MERKIFFSAAFLSIFLAFSLSAADWPRWRGSRGDGIYRGNDISLDALKKELKETWAVNIGKGYCAPSIKGDKLYILGNGNKTDTVYCLDTATGREIWKYSYPCSSGSYPGPRSTPYVEGTSVYTLSREGHLFCFDGTTGKVIWKKHLTADFGAQSPEWGFAGSPVIAGNTIFYNANKWGLALNKKTGELQWSSPKGVGGYSTPAIFSSKGKRGVLLFSQNALIGADMNSGAKLWEYPWKTNYDVNAADPLVIDNKVFISSGYGRGGTLLDLSKKIPGKIWENKNMSTHFSSFLYNDGYIYGSDGNAGSRSNLRCLDAATGKIVWEQSLSVGSLISTEDLILFYSERGEVITIALSSKGYTEISRFKPYRGSTTWTAPVIANGKLYLRDDRGSLHCFNIGK